jgi:hypothetical protein
MSNPVLFQMWGPFRNSLVAEHEFYVEQARKRLLSQFNDIESEAQKAAEQWLEKSSQRFDPDRHDVGDFYEAANDAGIEFGLLLSEMQTQTMLSVVAGMFHQWDKKLREWLVREIQHWHYGSTVTAKIWQINFPQMISLLESFGWMIQSTGWFPRLEACSLVVNVYKHGSGNGLGELKARFSEYLENTLGDSVGLEYSDHTHLRVNDAQFQAFADAIVEFWKAIPENTFESHLTSVPEWFEKAILKDQASRT